MSSMMFESCKALRGGFFFKFPYAILYPLNFFFFFFTYFVEEGEPRSAGGGKTQHPSQEDSGRENEEADAERGVLEKKRGRRALENGNAVWLWSLPVNCC